MDLWAFLERIGVCFLLGVIIGFERQCRRKVIGLRTNTLVSLGSFLFVAMSCLVHDQDVTRVAAQVVSGIGFLGAGVILRDGLNIRGLNTAATLWCSGAIGTLTAFGLLIEASIGTGLILFANVFLRFLGKKIMYIQKRKEKIQYVMELECSIDQKDSIKRFILENLKKYSITLKKVQYEKRKQNFKMVVTFDFLSMEQQLIENMMNEIGCSENITSFHWIQMDKGICLDEEDSC